MVMFGLLEWWRGNCTVSDWLYEKHRQTPRKLHERQGRLAYRQRLLDRRMDVVEGQLKSQQRLIDSAFRKIEEAARAVEKG